VQPKTHLPIKLFVFPPMFEIPNLSPFCCKLETWLRIAQVPYQVVELRDPRSAPRKKLPFIEENGVRIADSSVIIDHLSRTREIDLDANLTPAQRTTSLFVKRTLEDHYAFAVAYTHLLSDAGAKHTRSPFDALPSLLRPLIERVVQKSVKRVLWNQGILRAPHDGIIASAMDDWRAVVDVMSAEAFFFGEQVTNLDATVFGMLAPTVLTPIDTPIRAFLRSQPKVLQYAERMRSRYFPELAPAQRKLEPEASLAQPMA
jgi:glutathione S-transferase